jgi:uncharacterized protein YndB with AHSA1/START domain
LPTPSLTIVRRIKAPPAKVYAAFTQPEHIARWWGPDGGPVLHAEADVRVGGRYRVVFRTLDGEQHETLGVYREVEPGRRLAFTFQWVSFPERQSLVTVDFSAAPEGTELTVLHEHFHDELVRLSHRDGWNGTLDKLQALLETSPERTADANA